MSSREMVIDGLELLKNTRKELELLRARREDLDVEKENEGELITKLSADERAKFQQYKGTFDVLQKRILDSKWLDVAEKYIDPVGGDIHDNESFVRYSLFGINILRIPRLGPWPYQVKQEFFELTTEEVLERAKKYFEDNGKKIEEEAAKRKSEKIEATKELENAKANKSKLEEEYKETSTIRFIKRKLLEKTLSGLGSYITNLEKQLETLNKRKACDAGVPSEKEILEEVVAIKKLMSEYQVKEFEYEKADKLLRSTGGRISPEIMKNIENVEKQIAKKEDAVSRIISKLSMSIENIDIIKTIAKSKEFDAETRREAAILAEKFSKKRI